MPWLTLLWIRNFFTVKPHNQPFPKTLSATYCNWEGRNTFSNVTFVRGNSFTTYFALNSVALGLFNFPSMPLLNISINLFILSFSWLVNYFIWHSECSKGTHWFLTLHRPNPFFLQSLFLPCWQIVSQEPNFETVSVWVCVCVCMLGGRVYNEAFVRLR